jgi:GNAT superfamily N-acetyltransferase
MLDVVGLSSSYRLREVDGDEYAEELQELNTATFGDTAPPLTEQALSEGFWWLAFHRPSKDMAGFGGIVPSIMHEDAGYHYRAGVMPLHRGVGLQRRLLRAREAKARRLGWRWVHTDTTDNIPSANSLIAAGYRLFQPTVPWAFAHTLYWRKRIERTKCKRAEDSLRDGDGERSVDMLSGLVQAPRTEADPRDPVS